MNPYVNLKLKQDIFTYILRVMDLNFNYTDYLSDLYDFRIEEEYFKSSDYLLKFKVNIATPYLIFNIYEKD